MAFLKPKIAKITKKPPKSLVSNCPLKNFATIAPNTHENKPKITIGKTTLNSISLFFACKIIAIIAIGIKLIKFIDCAVCCCALKKI